MSNFALVVVVARATTAREFGAFAIAYSVTIVLLVAVRAAVGETLTLTMASPQDGRNALGAATGLGLVVGVFLACAAVVLPTGPVRPWLLVFSAGLPLLILQDVGRYVGFASRTPRVATVSDGLWLGTQILIWSGLWAGGAATGTWLLVAWWLGAGLAALLCVPATGFPAVKDGLRWLGQRRRLALSFAGESLLATGANQTSVYAVGIIAGLPAAGALRATQTLLAPLRAVSSGIETVGLPEARARLRVDGVGGLLRFQWLVVTVLVAPGVVAVIGLTLMPFSVGLLLLDETWVQASKVVLPVGLGFLAGMALTGARLGLRAMRASGIVIRLYALGAVFIVVLGVGGAFVGGLLGSAWGLALAQVTVASMAWWHVMRLHSAAREFGK